MPAKAPPKARGSRTTSKDPTISVRMPKELLDPLETLAKAEGKARSDIIRHAVAAHLRSKGYLK